MTVTIKISQSAKPIKNMTEKDKDKDKEIIPQTIKEQEFEVDLVLLKSIFGNLGREKCKR